MAYFANSRIIQLDTSLVFVYGQHSAAQLHLVMMAFTVSIVLLSVT